jgi:hypothetical protein
MPSKRVLLVEGPDDEHVVKALCGRRSVGVLDGIYPLGGKDALLEALPVRIKESDIQSLGVMIDADSDLRSRWQAVRDRLLQAGYSHVPASPAADGTVLNPPANTLLPRVGIWVMPDNNAAGILEDFLQFLVPAQSALFRHVDQSVATIPEDEVRFSPLDRPKALIHTWLSWQDEPGKPLGQAITARYLDAEVPEADSFVAWLKRLFFA